MKRQIKLNIKRGLLSKLVLLVALFLGSSNVWGDVVSGNTIDTGNWNTQIGNYSSSWNTSNNGYIQANTWAYYVLVSKSTINMASKKIVISAKGIGDVAELSIRTSTTSNTDFSSFTNQVTYTKTELGNSSSNDFRTLEVKGISGTCYLLFFAKGVQISSLTIEDDTTPSLSVSPNEAAAFGSVFENSTKTYTVSNIGVGSMTVNFSNTNSGDFSILNSSDEVISSLSGIVNGSPQTFKIRFNYDSENLGEKNGTITVTPTYNVEDAVVISASATAISDNAPSLSVTPDTNTDLGETYLGKATYTVTNTGSGSMTVNITSDNSDFVVSPTTIENLGYNVSKDFTVTYTFAETAEKLGKNTANITVIPTYAGGVAKTYKVTATSNATVTYDETIAPSPSINYGSKAYIHLKYTPQAGWNTICMPFMLRNNDFNNMDIIFGEGWEAYTLSSYNEGTLTFSKVTGSTIDYGKPYLVYIDEAPEHPNGVLLKGMSTNPNDYPTTKGNATFKGTFTPIAAPGMEGKYGITSESKLAKGNQYASIKGFRAYLEVSGAAPARIMTIDSEGETTDLGFVRMVDQEAKDVYNLQGQKVEKGRKGIYIVNGKKVVIK